MERPACVAGRVQVEEVDKAVVLLRKIHADPRHDRRDHIRVCKADEIVEPERIFHQLVDPLRDQISVNDRHRVIGRILAPRTDRLDRVKDRVERRIFQLVKAFAACVADEFLPVCVRIRRPPRQGEARKQPRAGHHGRPPEEPFIGVVETEILDRDRPGALPEERDILSVPAEIADMPLDPADRRHLVVQAEIAVAAKLLLDVLVRQIAQRAEAVVGKYRDDPALCQFAAVKGAFAVDAGFKAAAVEEEHDRAVFCLLRRVDVQIQAVLAVNKNAALAKLALIEAKGRVFHMLVPGAVLRAGRAERRRVQHAVPVLHRGGICKTLRSRIGHAQEFKTVLPLVAAHHAAGGLKPDRADHFLRHASQPLFFF